MGEFPSEAELDEAYRGVHNLHAQYEGLGTLRQALEVYRAAHKHYEGLQAARATLEGEIAEAQARVAALAATHAARVDELEAQYQHVLAPLEARKEGFGADVRALRAQVEALTREAQTLQARRDALHAEIEAMLQRYRG